MNQRFLWRDTTGLDELLHERVVGRDLFENPFTEAVDARITDVSDDDLAVVTKKRADRRAHPRKVGVFTHRFSEFGCTVLNRLNESLLSNLGRLESFVGHGGDRLGRERASDVTTRVATHAVGNEKQVSTGVTRILIACSDSPDVTTRHRKDAGVHYGLSSKIVEPMDTGVNSGTGVGTLTRWLSTKVPLVEPRS